MDGITNNKNRFGIKFCTGFVLKFLNIKYTFKSKDLRSDICKKLIQL